MPTPVPSPPAIHLPTFGPAMIPHQANWSNTQAVVDTIKGTIMWLVEGVLGWAGQWILLAAPFVIGLLLLEWLLQRVGIQLGALNAAENVIEDMNTGLMGQGAYRNALYSDSQQKWRLTER